MTFQILTTSTFVISYAFIYILLKNTDNHKSTFEKKSMRWSSNDEIMQNTNTHKNVLLPKNENNLEVAFITNDQTFRLFNKRG